MADLKDKLALIRPAKVLARGVLANLVDFPSSDIDSLAKSKAELLRLERTFYSWLCQAYGNDTILPPPPAPLTKLDMIKAAAESTASALENLVNELALDPDTADPKTLGANTVAWQTFTDHYRWLVQSITDDTYWPAAPVGVGAGPAVGPGTPTGPALDGAAIIALLVPLIGTPVGKPLIDAVKAVVMGGVAGPLPPTP